MLYHTYILLNEQRTRTYVGQTADLDERLVSHNANKVKSTRGHGPWTLFYKEPHETRALAMKRERWFKSKAGRKRIKEMMLERWPSG